jgi:DUF2946 family protein
MKALRCSHPAPEAGKTPISTGSRPNDRNRKEVGKAMRRRLKLFIPMIMLAVLVQIFAPIGAVRAFATVANDPLHAAAICSGLTASADGQNAPSGTHTHDDACCAFCSGAAVGSVAVDAPPAVFISLQRQYQRVTWLEATDALAVVRVGSNAQARAPPSFS